MEQHEWEALVRKLDEVAESAPEACGAPCLVANCRRRIVPPYREIPAGSNIVPFRSRERLARQGGV